MARRGTNSRMKTTPRLDGAIGFSTTHVEAKVHFFETGMEGGWQAFEAYAVEKESDEGDVAAGVVEIKLDAGGEWGGVRRAGVDGVLGHDELAPLGGEEGGHCLRIRAVRGGGDARTRMIGREGRARTGDGSSIPFDSARNDDFF